MADAAERAGSVVRSSWSLLQQQQQQQQQHGGNKEGGGGHTIHDRWQSASSAFKKTREKVALGLQDTKEKVVIGLSDTKEKVAIGTVKAVEVHTMFKLKVVTRFVNRVGREKIHCK